MTIHNLKFQGVWDKKTVQDITGLPDYYFAPDKMEAYKDANYLKGGIVYADKVTTVSNTYAEEIKTTFYGEHLDGLMNARSNCLSGIVNGIDYEEYNPQTDKMIAKTYSADTFRKFKKKNKTALQEELFPLAEVITPNIPEAEVLTGVRIRGAEEMEQAAEILYRRWRCAVLLKGGHRGKGADDLLYQEKKAVWITGKRIENPNTHGTGCTLSSAIASHLARGCTLLEAVKRAKRYLSGALEAQLDLGKGAGPLDHGWMLEKEMRNLKLKQHWNEEDKK